MDLNSCWHSQHCQQTYGLTLVCLNWRFFVGNVGYLFSIANIANKPSADWRMATPTGARQNARRKTDLRWHSQHCQRLVSLL